MKQVFLFMTMCFALLSVQTSVKAEDDTAKGDQPAWRAMIHERQQMTQDVLGMIKETMAIIKNLNHKPSEVEKARLDEMMSKLDSIMEKEKKMAHSQEEMMDKRQEMREQRKDMRDKRQEMMKDNKGM